MEATEDNILAMKDAITCEEMDVSMTLPTPRFYSENRKKVNRKTGETNIQFISDS